MSYNISEIKKMSVQERLEIIDEIWETCVAANADSLFEDDEKLKKELEERVDNYESGKMTAIPWDEFVEKLKARRK